MMVLSLSSSSAASATKRNGCRPQESGLSISAEPSTIPAPVRNINFALLPAGSEWLRVDHLRTVVAVDFDLARIVLHCGLSRLYREHREKVVRRKRDRIVGEVAALRRGRDRTVNSLRHQGHRGRHGVRNVDGERSNRDVHLLPGNHIGGIEARQKRKAPQVSELAGSVKNGAAEFERSKAAYIAREILALLLASANEDNRRRRCYFHQRTPEHVSGGWVFHSDACGQERAIPLNRSVHIHEGSNRKRRKVADALIRRVAVGANGKHSRPFGTGQRQRETAPGRSHGRDLSVEPRHSAVRGVCWRGNDREWSETEGGRCRKAIETVDVEAISDCCRLRDQQVERESHTVARHGDGRR